MKYLEATRMIIAILILLFLLISTVIFVISNFINDVKHRRMMRKEMLESRKRIERMSDQMKSDSKTSSGGDMFSNMVLGALSGGMKRSEKWVSVVDMLPINDGKYLAATKDGNVFQVHYYKVRGWAMPNKGKNITHWRHMPDPPRKDVKDGNE